jgi:heme/copper-type cytochrome/quinol oxidase subunit 1
MLHIAGKINLFLVIILQLLNFSYRDFRSSTYPYSETSIYWNVLAARLAFIIIFEHVTFFIIYLIDWLVPDVPKKIQNKIDHERFIDQRERWASGTSEKNFKHAVIASEAISKMTKHENKIIKSPTKSNGKSPTQKSNRRAEFRVRISPKDQK